MTTMMTMMMHKNVTTAEPLAQIKPAF